MEAVLLIEEVPQLHQDLCVLHRGEDASVTPHVGAQTHQLHTGTAQNLPRNFFQLLPAEHPLPEIPHVHHENNGVNLPLPDSCIGHGADDLNLALEATVSPAHHLLGLVNGGYADEQVVQAGYGGLGNIDFIDQYAPEYLLVLSGDHIYKMNYDKMLAYHKERQADATIAVIEVPLKEASRFGIMNTDGETDRITEFVEKPPVPQSNLASMGIYIFNWKLLRKLLLADMKNPESSHDFGKDIIPTLLNDGKRLFAYRFKGYWKDVGTIDSLWEANMDLLSPDNELDLSDRTWTIYTEDVTALPQYIGTEAKIQNAYITQGCIIEGEVTNSVIFTGAKVRPGAKVIDSVLMPGAVVEDGAVVVRALVANGITVGKGALVGSADSEHIELIAKRVKGAE